MAQLYNYSASHGRAPCCFAELLHWRSQQNMTTQELKLKVSPKCSNHDTMVHNDTNSIMEDFVMASRPAVIPEAFTGNGEWTQWIYHFKNMATVNE